MLSAGARGRRSIRRDFAYQGAEHEVVHAWAAGDPLEVGHVSRHPLGHPRCATRFMLVVMALTVLAFLPLGRLGGADMVAHRVLLVPAIAAVADEVLKWGARPQAPAPLRAVLAPGRKLQRLTTREPDEAMLEVAIAALLRVLATDGRVDGADPRMAGARRVDAAARPLPAPGVGDGPKPVAAD